MGNSPFVNSDGEFLAYGTTFLAQIPVLLSRIRLASEPNGLARVI